MPARWSWCWAVSRGPQALLSAGVDARVDAPEVHIDQISHAWLADHASPACRVVPVVLVAEWMARAVRTLPSGRTCTCER